MQNAEIAYVQETTFAETTIIIQYAILIAEHALLLHLAAEEVEAQEEDYALSNGTALNGANALSMEYRQDIAGL